MRAWQVWGAFLTQQFACKQPVNTRTLQHQQQSTHMGQYSSMQDTAPRQMMVIPIQ